MFEEDILYLSEILKTIPANYSRDISDGTSAVQGVSKSQTNRKTGSNNRNSGPNSLYNNKFHSVLNIEGEMIDSSYIEKGQHENVVSGAHTAGELKRRISQKIEELRAKRRTTDKQNSQPVVKNRRIESEEGRSRNFIQQKQEGFAESKLGFIDTKKQKEKKSQQTSISTQIHPQKQTLQRLKEKLVKEKGGEKKDDESAWMVAVKRASGERVVDPKKKQKRKMDRERKKNKSRKIWKEKLENGKSNGLLRRPGFEGVAFKKSKR